MKLSNFIAGLEILKAYYEGQDGYHIWAEHDEFYSYRTDRPMPPDSVKQMVALGWFQTGHGADSEHPENYNPESGWMAYI